MQIDRFGTTQTIQIKQTINLELIYAIGCHCPTTGVRLDQIENTDAFNPIRSCSDGQKREKLGQGFVPTLCEFNKLCALKTASHCDSDSSFTFPNNSLSNIELFCNLNTIEL